MTTRNSWILRGAVVAALGALSGGCGGLGPGDYVVYRVAQSELVDSSSCPGYDDPSQKSDSSTFLSTSTFILYAGLEDVYYLEAEGQATLEGTEDGGTYSFSGKTVDVEYPTPDIKFTSTTSASVSMTVDGASANGTATVTTSTKCSGTGCPDDTSCKQTSEFVGTEVEDVELKHDL